MAQAVTNSIPIFVDASGKLLSGGNIYLGIANGDPQTQPIVAYWDLALTQVALQPLRTIGGRIVNGASPARVFVEEEDYSQRVLGFDQTLIDYSPSVFTEYSQFQTRNADLDTISGQNNAAFGLNLLTIPDQMGFQTAVGVLPYLSTSGGTVTGDVHVTGTTTVDGNVNNTGGAYQLGSSGGAYVGLDTNGYLIVNGVPGMFMRVNPSTLAFEFFIGEVKVFHIDGSGAHTP